METVKQNLVFLFMLLALGVGAMLPVDGLVSGARFESLKVPRLEVPNELRHIAEEKSLIYPAIDKKVLLGYSPEIIAASKNKKTTPRLRLRALMIDGDARLANINGVLMRVGGVIHQHRVLKIEDKGVLLQGPGGKRLLTMR